MAVSAAIVVAVAAEIVAKVGAVVYSFKILLPRLVRTRKSRIQWLVC